MNRIDLTLDNFANYRNIPSKRYRLVLTFVWRTKYLMLFMNKLKRTSNVRFTMNKIGCVLKIAVLNKSWHKGQHKNLSEEEFR